jgi:hypothetical protein
MRHSDTLLNYLGDLYITPVKDEEAFEGYYFDTLNGTVIKVSGVYRNNPNTGLDYLVFHAMDNNTGEIKEQDMYLDQLIDSISHALDNKYLIPIVPDKKRVRVSVDLEFDLDVLPSILKCADALKDYPEAALEPENIDSTLAAAEVEACICVVDKELDSPSYIITNWEVL